MKVRLWQALSIAFVAALYLQLPMVTGCSKDDQQTDQLQSDQQGNAAEGGDQTASNDTQAQATTPEGDDTAPVADDASAKQEGDHGEGNINAVENQAPDDQVAQSSADQPASPAQQQEDLQEIIQDMNKNGPQGSDTAAQGSSQSQGANPVAQTGPQDQPAAAAAAPVATAQAQQQAQSPAPTADAAGQAAPAAPAGGGLPEMGSKMAYVVQKGDSLGSIAQKVYGDKGKWKEIADFTGLANPSRIYPGDIVYYQLSDQTKSFASAYESVTRSEVEVQPGDTLSRISGRVLGNPADWRLIWRQNDGINDPDKLVVGIKIYYINHGSMAENNKEIKTKLASEKSISNDISGQADELTQTTNDAKVIGNDLNNTTVLNAQNNAVQIASSVSSII